MSSSSSSSSMEDNNNEEVEEEVKRAYRTPGHPTAYSAPKQVYEYFDKKIPYQRVREILDHLDVYSLHREYKQPKVYNPYYSYQRRTDFQMDLIDIASLKRTNRGVTFLLVIIDVFSRKIWVVPLKRKTGTEVKEALSAWIAGLEAEAEDATLSPSMRVLHDSGREFLNQHVKQLFAQKGIRQNYTTNIHKAAIAERVNKSLQILIYKYLTDAGETRYLAALPELVSTYNSRKHRSLGKFSPNEADLKENEEEVRNIHKERYDKINAKRKAKAKYKVGDRVRVKTLSSSISSSRRAYVQQFHGEMYEIVEVKTRMPIPMYTLKSLDKGDVIEGGFYGNEITPVRGDLFKIEKILRRRGRGRNRQLLVRWKHFGPHWDSWINESDIVDN